jgi:hypothetical protein
MPMTLLRTQSIMRFAEDWRASSLNLRRRVHRGRAGALSTHEEKPSAVATVCCPASSAARHSEAAN